MVVCILLALAGGGCIQAYAILIDPLIPPPKIKPEYDMSKQKVLVWIDQTGGLGDDSPLLRRSLTEKLNAEFVKHKAVAAVTPPDDVTNYRQSHTNYSDLPIQKLGQDFGTDLVFYVLIENFSLQHEAGADFYRPQLAASLKIIQVKSGQRVWPIAQTSHNFSMVGNMLESQEREMEAKLIDKISAQVAAEIAIMFYEHPGKK